MTTATTADTRPTEVDSEPRPAQDLFKQASAIRNEWDANEQQDQRDSEDASIANYLDLLRRKDNPREGDARDLADCMAALDIDAERLAQDFSILQEALGFQAQRDRVDEAHEIAVAARNEHLAMQTRHREEEHDISVKNDVAFNDHKYCRAADYELVRLKRQRPLLFTKPGEGGPVRLVGTDPIE